MNSDRLCLFLSDTLRLWQVQGTVERGGASLVTIRAGGTRIDIDQIEDDAIPFRWSVRVHSETEAPERARRKLCGSLVGVLSAARAALGVDRGAPLRVTRS